MDEMRWRGFAVAISAFVFQSFHLVPTMTALENVALPLELADRPRRLRRGGEGVARSGLE